MGALICLLLGARVAGAQATAIAITSCPVIIPAGATGVLQNDVACDGFGGIVVHHGATLDLNGHRVSGSARTVDLHATTEEQSVRFGRWRIRGPGEIAAARRDPGPRANSAACVGMLGRGIATISDVTIRDCQDVAIWGDRVRAVRVRVADGAGTAFVVESLKATDVVIEDHTRDAIAADHVDAQRLAVRRNGSGISATTIRANDVEVTDNAGDGIAVTGRAYLVDLTATGNDGYGVRAASFLRLFRAVVTGNGGAPGGVDVASDRKPVIARTTCGRSVKSIDPAQSFGVCANDP